MFDFLSLKPNFFGLDISDLSLKFAELRKSGNFSKLKSFGESELKPGLIRSGEIKDEKAVAEVIRNLVYPEKGKGVGSNYVVASLPEEKAFLQIIKMPKMSWEDLRSAVIYEAENYIPLPIEQVYLDFQVIPDTTVNNPKELEVLIVAVPKSVADPYFSCIKAAGLKPLAMEIESLSVSRAVVEGGFSKDPLFIIDMGATRTSFMVYFEHSLRFNFFIPVSSHSFTENISRAMKISLAKAEKLKIKYGLETDAKKEGGEIFENLIPALSDLIDQIRKYIDYYNTHPLDQTHGDNPKVKKIIICGGGANLKGLDNFLFHELKIPVEIANPWANVLGKKRESLANFPTERSLSYTSAIGLAQYKTI